jgi:hypothetical protein
MTVRVSEQIVSYRGAISQLIVEGGLFYCHNVVTLPWYCLHKEEKEIHASLPSFKIHRNLTKSKYNRGGMSYEKYN